MKTPRRHQSALCQDEDGIALDRRQLIVGGTAVATGFTTTTSADAAAKPSKLPPQPGDRIQVIKGRLKGEFVRPDMLEPNAPQIEAFPFDLEAEVLRRKNRLNRLLVVRLDPSEMDEETRKHSAGGVLAFSAICTHRGCTIKSWMQDERQLRCHCHLSRFAALEGGIPLDGPARRSLPMVPLELDGDGFVVATGGFTGKVGGAKK